MGDGSDRHLAVVTGATSGIGAALATRLAACRFDLVIAGAAGDLDGAAERLAEAGGAVLPVRVDLASRDGVEELHDRVAGLDRPIDVLNVNVEVGRSAGPPSGGDGGGPHVLDLDVRGALHLLDLCVPAMARVGRGGVLVTSSSGAGTGSEAHLASCVEATRTAVEATGVTVTLLVLATDDPAVTLRAQRTRWPDRSSSQRVRSVSPASRRLASWSVAPISASRT